MEEFALFALVAVGIGCAVAGCVCAVCALERAAAAFERAPPAARGALVAPLLQAALASDS